MKRVKVRLVTCLLFADDSDRRLLGSRQRVAERLEPLSARELASRPTLKFARLPVSAYC